MSLKIGQTAPDFTLFDSEKQKVTLSEQRGSKVILMFFPAAFTSTCTVQLCTMRDDLSWYNNLNAKVYGISTDSLFVLAKYKESNNLNFQLLADFNKEVCGLYDAQYDEFVYGMKGVSKRAAFVIDENGKILYAEVLDKAGDLPDFEKIKRCLD